MTERAAIHKPPDAPIHNWVDRFAPPLLIPWLRLARMDRPIGAWLLLWPCFWSLAAASSFGSPPPLSLYALFAAGAILMRGAGCTFNDLADRNFDARIPRTRSRPLPSGAVSVRGAVVFLVAQCALAACLLALLNPAAIIVGLLSLPLILLYPFMKRFTHWPQFFLGLAFSWGALLGWSAALGALHPPAFLLYAAALCWTIGYDTIYALQDKEDDALLGLKSTAILFGSKVRLWLCLFYGGAIFFLALAGSSLSLGAPFWAIFAAASLHLVWQITRLDRSNAALCLKIFRSNRDFGAIVFLAFAAALL